MSPLEVRGNVVAINGSTINVGARILDARANSSLVLVPIDPDSYLKDPDYRRKRRAGLPAVRNLQVFSFSGTKLWDADMPEEADYYYKIVSVDPIEVASFSAIVVGLTR